MIVNMIQRRAGAYVRTTNLPGISIASEQRRLLRHLLRRHGIGPPAPPRRITRRAAWNHAPQLVQRARIDRAFEVDDLADRLPVVHPAPAIEFGLGCGVESERHRLALQLQQEPVLLLTHTYRLYVSPHVARWQSIAQPMARASYQPHVIVAQADLLAQL